MTARLEAIDPAMERRASAIEEHFCDMGYDDAIHQLSRTVAGLEAALRERDAEIGRLHDQIAEADRDAAEMQDILDGRARGGV